MKKDGRGGRHEAALATVARTRGITVGALNKHLQRFPEGTGGMGEGRDRGLRHCRPSGGRDSGLAGPDLADLARRAKRNE
jgi:hypothetical protein